MAIDSSDREFTENRRRDLGRKLVVLTGARQAGKPTLARQLMSGFEPSQYLNWDVPADRLLITQRAWSPKARLVVFDEIHKMRDWKVFLKGAWDGRSKGQAMLVIGSACMETFRQGGESLAGRYCTWRLHPFSVRELMVTLGVSAEQALARLLERGGFPEPCLSGDAVDADRWRAQYASDLVREDVLDFSRVHEVRTLQLLFELLLKHCHHRQDAEGKAITLHTIRDKERHEIDFVLAEGDAITDLVEVKLSDATPSAYLHRMAERLAPTRAVQIVGELRQPAQHGLVEVASADGWLAGLAA